MTEENNEQPVSELDPEQKKELKKTLLNSPEGKCLLFGAVTAFMYFLWLSVKMMLSPTAGQTFLGMTATQAIFGRAVSIAFGYSMGFGYGTVIAICMIVETIVVLIFYPLFVFSWRHLLVIKQLKILFDRIRESAEANKDIVLRYGIAGLFLFVWFPFWMTGPLVGSVIGFMMGLQTWLNLTVVLSGTYVAIIGWAIFLRQFHNQVSSYSSYALLVLLILVFVIILAGHLLHKMHHEDKNKE
ncbi:MAG: small multi-drug export protein [Sedimentisphaerales bacterium]|nr:small multi-drug export protein [Sedimentisphaerales bacterium]